MVFIAGAGDGAVKFWDLRYAAGTSACLTPGSLSPVLSIDSMEEGPKRRGITCLARDPTSAHLVVGLLAQ